MDKKYVVILEENFSYIPYSTTRIYTYVSFGNLINLGTWQKPSAVGGYHIEHLTRMILGSPVVLEAEGGRSRSFKPTESRLPAAHAFLGARAGVSPTGALADGQVSKRFQRLGGSGTPGKHPFPSTLLLPHTAMHGPQRS